MEISADKSKILVNSINPGKSTRKLDQFKYLADTQTKDGTSIKEVKIRLAQAHSVRTRLAKLWKNKATSFPTQK